MFNVNDWYWTTASDPSHVFSSKTGQIVSKTDSDYISWCQDNQLQAKVTQNYAELYLYLTKVSPTVASQAEAVLSSHLYPSQIEKLKIDNGVAVEFVGHPNLNATYAVDADAVQRMMMTAAGLSVQADSTTLLWPTNDEKFVTFTKSQFLAFQTAVLSYVFNVMNTATMLNAKQQASWPAVPLQIA